MQNPKHWQKECKSCGAQRNQPCLTVDGFLAERVHWGRGSPPRCKIIGRSKELDFWLQEFEVITRLLPDNVAFLTGDDRPVLFEGTNICAECGEPFNQVGLVRKCSDLHSVMGGA